MDKQIRAATDAEVQHIIDSILPMFPDIDKDEFTQRVRERLQGELDQIDKEDSNRVISEQEARDLSAQAEKMKELFINATVDAHVGKPDSDVAAAAEVEKKSSTTSS